MSTYQKVNIEVWGMSGKLSTGVTKLFYAFFVLCGAKFYMDWLLITNPASKNPYLKRFWLWVNEGEAANQQIYYGYNVKERLKQAKRNFFWHFLSLLFMFPLCFMPLTFFSFNVITLNLIVNIYPCIIQIYIGIRCWRVINFKNRVTN